MDNKTKKKYFVLWEDAEMFPSLRIPPVPSKKDNDEGLIVTYTNNPKRHIRLIINPQTEEQ